MLFRFRLFSLGFVNSIVAAVLGVASQNAADAAPIIEDGFATGVGDYSVGALNGQTGTPETGSYAGAWSTPGPGASFGAPQVFATGLSYIDGSGNALTVSGGGVRMERTSGGSFQKEGAVDPNGTPPGSSGDSVYFSGILDLGGASNAWFGIEIGIGDAAKDVIGIGVNSSGNAEIRQDGAVSATSVGTYDVSDPLFLVGRIQADGGAGSNDLAYLYLNPLLPSEPVTPDLTHDVGTAGWFPAQPLDLLQLSAGMISGTAPTFFDEFRIGTSWADVTPFTAAPPVVPEPSTLALALLGLFGLGLFGCRRRRSLAGPSIQLSRESVNRRPSDKGRVTPAAIAHSVTPHTSGDQLMRLSTFSIATVLFFGFTVAAHTVDAALLSYDPIDTSDTGSPSTGLYDDGQFIRNQGGGPNVNHNIENGNIVGYAASTTAGGHNWATTNTGLFIANGSAGLTATGADYASGGAIRYSGFANTTARGIRRTFLDSVPRLPTAANQSHYFSFLLQAVGTDSGDGFDGQAMVGFSDNTASTGDLLVNTGNTYGPIVGFEGAGGNMDLIYRHRTAGNTLSDLVLVDGVTAGETYQVVVRIDANTSSFNDDFSIFINPTTDTEPVTATFTGTDASIGTSADQQMDRLLVATRDFADAVVFDEFRYGTTWQDVVSIAAVVPEPNTFLLAAFGLLSLGLVRTRRRCR